MRTHRFGRKIKHPATIVIKHQIRMVMALAVDVRFLVQNNI